MNYKQLTEKNKVEIEILLKQNLSMREVGRRLGISHSTISRYKAGIYKKRKIDINEKYKIFIKYLFEHYDRRDHSIEVCVYQFKRMYLGQPCVSVKQVYNWIEQGKIYLIPQSINVLNNAKSETRFIFKYGFGVEDNWHKETFPGIKGEVYFNYTSKVYKFPIGNDKYDYKTVDIRVNAINENPNTKFCYSTSLGTSIDTSRENCFRTGRYIPYTLSFINPLIMGKNYQTYIDNYYITIKPFNYYEDISIEITENKYDVKNRNELGKAKQLTLSGNTVSSILTIPKQPMNIIIQVKSCEKHANPNEYIVLNAFSKEKKHDGKIYYTDKIMFMV